MTASSSLNINFGLTLTTLPTIASLRNYASQQLCKGDCIVVAGNIASGDHGGGLFVWSPTSTDLDDGAATIQPVDRSSGAGRWEIITPLGQAAIAAMIAGLASSADLALPAGSESIGYSLGTASAVDQTVAIKLNQRFDLTDWGTLAECQADAGIVLNRAMSDVATVGGTIYLPQTTMNISTPVVMAPGVTLDGDSWIEVRGNSACFTRTDTTLQPFTFPLTSPGGGIRNCAFFEAQTIASASTWAPIIYPAWITVLGTGQRFESLYFGGCYKAMLIGSMANATGRQLIENVRGEFFGVGIDLVNAADTIRIRGFHHWPFYSGTAAGTQSYSRNNAVGIRATGVDSLQVDDTFMEIIQVGVEVAAASTVTRLKASNLDVRSCAVSVLMNATTLADLTNITTIDTDTVGIQCGSAATNCVVNLTSYEGQDSKNNLLRLDGTGNLLQVCNAYFSDWNTSLLGFSAVSIGVGNTGKVSNMTFSGTGNSYDAAGTLLGVSDQGTFASSTNAAGQVVITSTVLTDLVPSFIDLAFVSSADLSYSVASTAAGTFTVLITSSNTGEPVVSTPVTFVWRASI